MWSPKKSLVLSKVCTIAFGLGLVAILAFGPWVVNWFFWYAINPNPHKFTFFMVTLYTGGVTGGILLWYLYRLLNTIDKGQVFVPENVSSLRWISWCCFAGAAIALVSGFYYVSWFVVAAAAAFVGLIVRVVKNVIAQSVILKEEHDYTI